MSRTTSLLTLFFLFISACYSSCFIPHAYPVPILRDQPKKKPYKKTTQQQTTSGIKIIGAYADISTVKKGANCRRKSRPFRQSALSAKSIIVIDAHSGGTIYSRSPDTPRQPASTIKVITGILAIDLLRNEELITVSKKAARQPRSKIYLDSRKTYPANDLINAVLLASANDASVALAEKIAGSERSFAKMMTSRAQKWGAKNTVCKTASGLTARGQKTTARDLATIFRQAMRDREFASRMKKRKIRTAEGKLLRNHNKALWQIKGALAGKTGYTHAARQTYVGTFKRGEKEIIVAIMGSESMWNDIKRLVSYGFSHCKTAGTAQLKNDSARFAALVDTNKSTEQVAASNHQLQTNH
ncbi:MAG: D-alanyl-D-alanine carboxypeptidase [Desulfobacterales bacterium]|nr:MAG: D-alanyl-D-alanine carboxypeptidase [Desulfobacterales bacterium]